MFSKKVYGKLINYNLESLIGMLNLAHIYQLKQLKQECILSISNHFTKKQTDQHKSFTKLDPEFKLEIYDRMLNQLEDKLHQNDIKFKQLYDENLKQKFEIKRLEFALNQNLK